MLKEMLNAVGVLPTDTILLHSDLTAYSRQTGDGSYIKGCENAVTELTENVNTLVVPTFNYDFSNRETPYIHEKTPSQVGWFTNYLLFELYCRRSFHPVFSFASLGYKQRELMENVSKDAFGINSVFDRLYNINAKIVFLSVPATFATFVHYIEQRLNVWYRYKKYFTGQVTKDGETWIDTFSLYVRDLDKGVENNFKPLLDLWVNCDIIKHYEVNKDLYINSISCQDLFNVARCAIVQYPNVLITYKEN